MNMRKGIACLVLSLMLYSVSAQVKLASIFTDNLVLQQKSMVSLWGWTKPGKNVTVVPSWDKKTYTTTSDKRGRFEARISTPEAGGPYQISFNDGATVKLNNVLIGEVWLCSGQSNMEMPVTGFKGQPVNGSNDAILRSSNQNIRLYTVPRASHLQPQENSKPSEWKMAGPESVSNFSATAYFFGKDLNELLNVPVGLINVSYGGSPVESWMDAKTLGPFPEIKLPTDSIKSPNRTPTTLFNGMLHPVIGYTIRGFIWYQGESNYDNPDLYERLFPTMVQQGRMQWKAMDLPFYFAQIAPYDYAQLPPYHKGGKYNSAYLRDAQRKSLTLIPHSGMAVLMDAGVRYNIHPPQKKEAGQRLALLALSKTYALKGFGAESPTFDTLVIKDSIAEVKFRNAPNWLSSNGKELTQFEIAGADKIFHPARAVIYRSSVMVSSPIVKKPVAVRYAFQDFIIGELFSTEGLPVSSFRTDNW